MCRTLLVLYWGQCADDHGRSRAGKHHPVHRQSSAAAREIQSCIGRRQGLSERRRVSSRGRLARLKSRSVDLEPSGVVQQCRVTEKVLDLISGQLVTVSSKSRGFLFAQLMWWFSTRSGFQHECPFSSQIWSQNPSSSCSGDDFSVQKWQVTGPR